MTDVLARARRVVAGRVGDVTLNLPFVSIAVSPRGREREIAREILIRLRDRRVLSSHECCDSCIDDSLASLQEIRQVLVDKQVALSDLQDGPLFLMIDMMRQGIRQFITYEERLTAVAEDTSPGTRHDFRRAPEVRQAYFDALELLRGHISPLPGSDSRHRGNGDAPGRHDRSLSGALASGRLCRPGVACTALG